MFNIFLSPRANQERDKTQTTVKKSLWQNAFHIDKCDEMARKSQSCLSQRFNFKSTRIKEGNS